MPFCVLAEKWDKQNPKSHPTTRGTQSYNVKLLSIYFGVTPIGNINLDSGLELKQHLLHLAPLRGSPESQSRSELSINQTLGVLRSIFTYAWEQRWIKTNPLAPRGRLLTSRQTAKTTRLTRLMTADEESKLLTACTGKIAYLQEALICLADTGMYDEDRKKLTWANVDLNNRLIKGSGSWMKMTPRLHAAILLLWNRSDQDAAGLVWNKEINRDFKQARNAAKLDSLVIGDLRPTAAWRMKQAGYGFQQIANALGINDFNYLRRYLEVDPEAEQREIESPSFRETTSGLLGQPDSGNEQKNGRVVKRKAGRKAGSKTTDPKQTVADIQRKILELKASNMSISDVTANLVADKLHIGGVTGGNTMMRRVNKGINIKWVKLRDYIWDGGDIEQLNFNCLN